jgi:hypothetical protein
MNWPATDAVNNAINNEKKSYLKNLCTTLVLIAAVSIICYIEYLKKKKI